MNNPTDSPVVKPKRAAKTLAAQKADFTAEGAPAPASLATPAVGSADEARRASPGHRPVRGTISLKRAASGFKP